MHEVLKAEFGLNADRLEALSGGRVTRLWRCGEWVVKLYDHRQVPAERAERAVRLQHMAAEAGLPVPKPLKTRSGSLWAPSDEGMVVVMPFVHGSRRVRGTLSCAEAASLGDLLGRLHGVFRTIPVEPGGPSPDFALARWGHLRQLALAVEDSTDFDAIVLETAEYVAGALKRMPAVDWQSQPWHMCHGDLHLDNILFDDTGAVVGVLDFDNAAPSWPGVELMMAWNLCFGADPGRPELSPETAIFFAQYRPAMDLAAALRAHWFVLISNTWPALLRYREGTVKPEWTEIISMRLRAAQWLEANMEAVSAWLRAIPSA